MELSLQVCPLLYWIYSTSSREVDNVFLDSSSLSAFLARSTCLLIVRDALGDSSIAVHLFHGEIICWVCFLGNLRYEMHVGSRE